MSSKKRELYQSTFTIDVEDGVSIAMRDVFSKKTEQTLRVVTFTTQVLDLLEKYEINGTFFILGEVGERFPDLVKKIANAGHEIGVHGYHHLQFFRMTPEEALQELSSAKKLLEDLTGSVVTGHRAPAFSITPETKWGLDVIAEAGFKYDSSIMPIKGRRYGWPGFTKDICRIQTPSGHSLIEVPLSTVSIMGKDLPVCGGGYLRLFPEWFSRKAFEQVAAERPAIVYMHPYELDTERYPDYYFDELNRAGFLKRQKMKSMWLNRKTVYPKLSTLLENYEFEPLVNIVRKHVPEEADVVI